MAINYTNLFGDVGELIKCINQFRNMATGSGSPVPDLPDLLDGVETQLNSTSRHDILSGIPEMFDGFKNAALGWIDQLGAKITDRLTHKSTVLNELPGATLDTNVQTVLSELYREMVADSASIKQSSVTIGAVTADGGNSGNGQVLKTVLLDGVTAPGAGILANREYAGVDSELAVSEAMTLTCIADEDTNGRTIGEELFRWESDVPYAGTGLGWDTESSGTTKTISTLNTWQIIANKDFESWSANVPSSWTIDAGTAGTHVVQETVAASVYRGYSALELNGDGSQATIQLSQTLPARSLVPQRMYCLACFVKGTASTAAGTLTIEFESPSGEYTAASTEKIEMNAAALSAQTTYGIEYFFFVAPEQIPDDMELVIKVTGTLTNAKSVHVDGLAFGPVDYANGIGIAVVAGSDQFVVNDRFNFSVTNDDAGVFQTYMRKKYKVQLPSAGSPSISDSLAT